MIRSVVAAMALTASLQSAALAAAPQLVAKQVELDGRTWRALCSPGPAQALLMPDAGASPDDWRPVLERLVGVVGACACGRPAADPETDGRGWFELMDDMRRVHEELGFHRGYTLVGHAVAGLYVRLYAAQRPMDVAGLVLVEPAHADMPEEMEPGMPRVASRAWKHRRLQPNRDGVRERDLAERAREVRLPDVPVTVITATVRPDGDGWDRRFLNEAARRLHASLLVGITHGRHVPAARSGEDVHRDEPELVAREITRVVRQSSDRRR